MRTRTLLFSAVTVLAGCPAGPRAPAGTADYPDSRPGDREGERAAGSAAAGSSRSVAPLEPAAPVPPAFANVAWLAGSWHGRTLDGHWQLVAGALYGIWFAEDGVELNVIDDTDNDGKP